MKQSCCILTLFFLLFTFSFQARGESFLLPGNDMVGNRPHNSLVTLKIPVAPGSNEFYKQTEEWAKYKKLRAYGWSAFFVGGALMTAGFIGYVIDNSEGSSTNNRGHIIAGIGGALTAASVPVLVFAYKNRRKAIKLGTTSQAIHMPLQGERRQAALAFSLSF